MKHAREQQEILVTGGTGKTGRRVAQRLIELSLPVRIGSRSGQPAFDWNEPCTWSAALTGIDAAYIAYYPDLAVPGALEAIRSFAAKAVEMSVGRLVLLSGRGEPGAQACEEIVRNSGVEFTVLRASWFSQNFSEGYLVDSILAGEIALPVGTVPEPFIDADDIAEIAVAALTEDRHVGQLYELTGPRLWTFEEATAEIGRVTGRPIRFRSIAKEEYTAALRDMQLPAELISLIMYLFTEVLDGRNAYVADGMGRALGRAGRDFSHYVCDAAATGVWDTAAQRGAWS